VNAIQHYREAEAALSYAWGDETSDPELTIATAQVHATLALVAVQALSGPREEMTKQWRAVFSEETQ